MKWINVKDELPKKGKYKIDYVSYGIFGIMFCAINSPMWKYNKTTHWAIMLPPSKQQLCNHKWEFDISWETTRGLPRPHTVYRYNCKNCGEWKKTAKKLH